MPSFDVVSEVDIHEVTNAVDQANRELGTRFDFKGIQASFELDKENVNLKAENEFQLKQMLDILQAKMAKRDIDINCMDIKSPDTNISEARQSVIIKQGIEQDVAKKIVRSIKDAKLKVQASIQGEKIRVTGKKRDDLQSAIGLLREVDMNLPLQYINFRD